MEMSRDLEARLNKTLDENIGSELRITYEEHYWDLHTRLGRTSDYAIECD